METFTPKDPDFKTRVRESFERQRFMDYIGALLTDLGPGSCEIRLPYRTELTQQHGFFHGGVVGTLADNSAGYAAFTLMPADATILTVEYKLNLMAPGKGEELVARGQVLRAGRTLTVCKADVYAVEDGKETICASMLETLIRLDGRSDGPAKGTGDERR